MLLDGMNTVVTGCNRGIGRAILEKFAENGANVYAVVRKESEEFTGYCNELMDKYGTSIKPVYIDLSDEEQVNEGAKQILVQKADG